MAKDWKDRKFPHTICLFDVDGTLTPARRDISSEMKDLLKQLRKVCVIGFVGGSDLSKQIEQIGEDVLDMFDFAFAENGLTAYRLGVALPSQSFINYIGESKYKEIVNFTLKYIADLRIPQKRGTFIEFRRGMINISPIGRNCSLAERDAFEIYDKTHQIRSKFVAALKEKFSDLNLTFSIGGQISFDVFPTGWDKTYALKHLELEGFDTIHFFGDKCFKGGNDYEIYTHEATTGHEVSKPEDTMRILNELFDLKGEGVIPALTKRMENVENKLDRIESLLETISKHLILRDGKINQSKVEFRITNN